MLGTHLTRMREAHSCLGVLYVIIVKTDSWKKEHRGSTSPIGLVSSVIDVFPVSEKMTGNDGFYIFFVEGLCFAR